MGVNGNWGCMGANGGCMEAVLGLVLGCVRASGGNIITSAWRQF